MNGRKGFLVPSLLSISAYLSPSSAFSDSLVVLGTYDGAGYGLEFEVPLSGMSATGVNIRQGSSTLPLEFDAGEVQWDGVVGGLNYTEMDDFLSQGFELEILQGTNTSVYSVTTGTLLTGDIPTRATGLNINTVGNPTRPTATWSGGDATADFLFLTFTDINGDEFTDEIVPVIENGTYTLQQDLSPGDYNVTLGYWSIANTLADTFAVSLISGSDVFMPDPTLTALVGVGETFSNVSISSVPIPAAGWLFVSGLLGLLTLVKRKKAA